MWGDNPSQSQVTLVADLQSPSAAPAPAASGQLLVLGCQPQNFGFGGAAQALVKIPGL